MPAFDATAAAALEHDFAPAFFILVDIQGDPIRLTTFGADVTFSGTGDSDLNGKTFFAFDPRAIQVSDVANSESGSDTLSIDLSGIVDIDDDLMQEIVVPSKWRGRLVRLWMQIYDVTGATQQGAVVPYYTGYASSIIILPSAKTQTIRLQAENYLAAFNQASNRDYLNQKDYDPSDTSANATLAAANLGRGTSVSGGVGGGDYGGTSDTGGGVTGGGGTGGGSGPGDGRTGSMPVVWQ